MAGWEIKVPILECPLINLCYDTFEGGEVHVLKMKPEALEALFIEGESYEIETVTELFRGELEKVERSKCRECHFVTVDFKDGCGVDFVQDYKKNGWWVMSYDADAGAEASAPYGIVKIQKLEKPTEWYYENRVPSFSESEEESEA